MCAVLDKIFDSIQFGLDEQSIPNLHDPDPGERVASWAYLLPASESKIFFHFREYMRGRHGVSGHNLLAVQTI